MTSEQAVEVETFRCVHCRQWVPVQDREPDSPYGPDGPICIRCADYYWYLWSHDAADPWESEEDELEPEAD